MSTICLFAPSCL